MFDREGFIEYVGDKSGNSYASGLNRIEKTNSASYEINYEAFGEIGAYLFI